MKTQEKKVDSSTLAQVAIKIKQANEDRESGFLSLKERVDAIFDGKQSKITIPKHSKALETFLLEHE